MFLHDYTYVDLPRELVRARLAADMRAGLEALAALARADGDALRRSIDATAPAPSLTGATVVTAGEPADVGEVTLIPLVWRTAAETPPVAVADLEIAALGRDRTQLTVLGRSTDSRTDGPVQHRVVQAIVRSFLGHLAGRLESGPDGTEGAILPGRWWRPRAGVPGCSRRAWRSPRSCPSPSCSSGSWSSPSTSPRRGTGPSGSSAPTATSSTS